MSESPEQLCGVEGCGSPAAVSCTAMEVLIDGVRCQEVGLLCWEHRTGTGFRQVMEQVSAKLRARKQEAIDAALANQLPWEARKW